MAARPDVVGVLLRAGCSGACTFARVVPPQHEQRRSGARTRGRETMRSAIFLIAWCCLVGHAASAPPASNVLVVFSNSRLLPANIDVDRGLREGITSSDRRVDLFAEFLDVPAFSGESYETQTAAYFKEKYAARPPRAIVAVGVPALDFLLRRRSMMFPGVPIVHVGVDRANLESRPPLPPDAIGIPVVYDLTGTAELALRLHPNAAKLVVVTGTDRFDRDREAELRAGMAALRLDKPVEYLAGLPSADVAARLGKLQRDDIVLTPGYFVDGAGREFVPRDSVAMMAAVSGGPIYVPYATFLGTGAVGGRMPSFVEMGRESGAIVNRVLDGVSETSLQIPASIPAPAQLDWRQVRRWGIREDAIPRDAIVHFREPTFWETYRTQAIIAAAVIALQAGLIAALLIERRLRRRTAFALAESEQRISLAAHAARLSMWVWDLAHDRIWANPRLRERAGLSREIPVSFEKILETVHPADRERFNAAVREAAANDTELNVEYRVVQPGGEVRWFAARGHAADGEPHCLTGVKMDITPRKAAELQAEADRAALTHMSRVSTMGQLSAAIAHQLNQPLAAILGNAETAAKMLCREPIDTEELKEILDDIVSEDHRAADVIRRLGALYRRGEMEMSELDLNELVHETLDLVRADFMMRQVSTSIELAPSLPRVAAGRIQLQQVLLNLMLNAAHAMSEVDAARCMITIRTSVDDGKVMLCVRDRGTGIDPAHLDRVFDPFWSTKPGGIGVGLAICHAIITAHRGTLTVANNPDRGASFCFTLPVQLQG
ncbi:MAG: PAS domain-containing protein [Burkholderiales bacterium]|nr:PAS domain-containing protein [Burkholderiales bacterium]